MKIGYVKQMVEIMESMSNLSEFDLPERSNILGDISNLNKISKRRGKSNDAQENSKAKSNPF